MKIASVADVKAQFSSFVRETERGPVIVTRNGKPVAVLLAVHDDDELEEVVLANSPRLRKILTDARRRIESGKGIPHDEFWAEVEAEAPVKKKRGRGNGRPKKAGAA